MAPHSKQATADADTELEQSRSDRAAENGKMEQVRDLLFGSQMREIERKSRDSSARFEGELAALSRNTLQRLAELDAKIEDASQNALQQLRREADARNKAIEDFEDRIGQLIRTVRAEVMGRLDQLQNEIGRNDMRIRDAVDRVEREMALAAAELRSTIAGNCEGLEASKIGKRDLAAILAELSLRFADEPAAD